MKIAVKILQIAVTTTVFAVCPACQQGSGTSDQSEAATETRPDSMAMATALTTTTCLMPTADSFTIDLTPHELDKEKGNWEISEFPKLVKTTATNDLPKRIYSIENEDFCLLQTVSRSIISATGNCTTSIAAVRIWLGMDPGKTKIVPVFEPIALCHYTTVGQNGTFDIKSAATPTYYTYNGSAFTPVTNTASAGVYQNHAQIKRSTNSSFQPFNYNKDVRSLIYSFQEIGKLIEDNDDNVVTIWNAVTKKPITAGDSAHYHTLLLGPPEIGPANKRYLTSFNLKYANLAHLCPTNCVQVVFARQ